MLKKVSFLLILALTVALFAACDPYRPPEDTTAPSTPAAPLTQPTTTVPAVTEPTAHIHSYFGQTVAATCTDDGFMLHSCDCGDQFRDSITPALGHDWCDWVIVTHPTADAEGLRERTCSRCGSLGQEILGKLTADHTHDYATRTVAPTCTQDGYTVYTCLCGETYTETAEKALGHSFTDYHSNADAACTSDGTKTAKCDRCEVTSTVTDPGTATGHSWGDWVTVTEPTVDCEGLEQRSCLLCGAMDNRILEKLPEVHIHTYAETVLPPTCTESGYTLFSCACGDSYREDLVDATGHSWGEWVVTKEPTADTEGMQTRICASCGATDSSVLEKLPPVHQHTYTKEKFPATCTDGGYTRCTCDCGDTYDEITSDPKGHTWGNWFVSMEPTTTSEGQRQRLCEICGAAEVGTLAILETEGAFIIVCWPETIGRNTVATVIIKGQPGVSYDIDVHYKSGVSSAKGLEDQTADENGYVIWTWKVGPSTAAGTFQIVITGGGQQQTVYFTVVVE